MALPSEIHPFHLAAATQGYQVSNSLRFRGSNSAYLSKAAYGSTTTNVCTWSCWIKRGSVDTSGTNGMLFTSTDRADYFDYFSFSGESLIFYHRYNYGDFNAATSALFRDPSAWYHVVLVIDSSQASNSNRAKIYVNGVQQSLNVNGTFTQNQAIRVFGNASATNIGGPSASITSTYFDGYMAEMYFIDSLALDPSYFGQTDSNGIWQPKKYTGSFGSYGLGFYLPFNDAASTTTLGYDRQLGLTDSSKNNWTLNNISVTSGYTYDVMRDSPTNYNDGSTTFNRGNYATFNPFTATVQSYVVDGNLGFNASSNGDYKVSTMPIPTTGKWYAEMCCTVRGGSGIVGWFGVCGPALNSSGKIAASNFSGILSRNAVSAQSAIYQNDSNIYALGYFGGAGDVWGIAVDRDANLLYIYQNGSLLTYAYPTIATGVGDIYFYLGSYTGNTGWINFGQRPFAYTPPAGYLALNTYNLPNPSLPLV